MSQARDGISASYWKVLKCYLKENTEEGRQEGYELGRSALEKKIGLLEIIDIYNRGLIGLLRDELPEICPKLESAGELLAAVLAPFEMTQRAYQESAQTLQQLNRELRAQTVELMALNKEFEAFSYSISHDLRAPLRRVLGFSHTILDDFADDIDENLRSQLTRIVSSAEQMERLIEAMLSLSKLSRKELYQETVNLSEMAKDICDELKSSHPEITFNVSITEDLCVWGDRALLQAALGNLIGNAFKFSKKKQVPTIEFGVYQVGTIKHYFVRDNGAGFDMRHIDKLFSVFQRLHSVEEFDGTGIGLATVKRIIERHGGKIWAEAEIDKGATFYFTLGEG